MVQFIKTVKKIRVIVKKYLSVMKLFYLSKTISTDITDGEMVPVCCRNDNFLLLSSTTIP